MGHVLIVEDEAPIRSVLRMQFEMAGHSAEAVANATDALSYLLSHQPDLILLDVMLPGIDGAGLCRAIRGAQATANTPVLAMSADHSRRASLFAAGATGFLEKPYTLDQLSAEVQRCLRV